LHQEVVLQTRFTMRTVSIVKSNQATAGIAVSFCYGKAQYTGICRKKFTRASVTHQNFRWLYERRGLAFDLSSQEKNRGRPQRQTQFVSKKGKHPLF
jgi:hypothetical protein